MPIKKYRIHSDAIFNKPVTRIQAAKLSDRQLLAIMQDLYDTHFQTISQVGVGLAANQIGHPYSIFLTYISDSTAANRNTAPLPLSFWADASYEAVGNETNLGVEGCYSVPNMIGRNIKRFTHIIVKATKINVQLENNDKLIIADKHADTFTLHDFHARLFQHEIDHLNPVRPIFYFEYLKGGIKALESNAN